MGEAREVMDRLTDALNSHDTEAGVALYADDATITDPFGTTTGTDQIREYWQTFFDAFPDMSGESTRKYESSSTAIDEWSMSGTHTGPLRTPDGQEIPATGKRVTMRGSDFAQVEGGLIVQHRVYFDQMEMLGQLGLLPEEAGTAA